MRANIAIYSNSELRYWSTLYMHTVFGQLPLCVCDDRENLNRDKYLLTQMDRDHWVPIPIIAGFNQVRKMTNRLELVVDVLRGLVHSFS